MKIPVSFRPLGVLMLVLTVGSRVHAQGELQSALHAKLETQLANVVEHLNGVMGYAIKDLFDIPGHPFIMSIATTYVARDDEGERAVEEVARLAYDYFIRLSRASSYGRVISYK